MNQGIQLIEGELDDPVGAMFSPQNIIKASGGVHVHKLGDDSLLAVEFYERKVPNKLTSTPDSVKYDLKEYVKIYRPGDKSSKVDRKVRPGDIRRFPMHYDAFKRGQGQSFGTPLSELVQHNLLTEDVKRMLETQNIRTVEHLAAANTMVVESWGPIGPEIQLFAKGYLNQKVELASRKDMEEMRSQLAEQQKYINELLGKAEENEGVKVEQSKVEKVTLGVAEVETIKKPKRKRKAKASSDKEVLVIE